MNKQLQIFKNEEFGEIRALEIEGEPWLVGRDVAKTLGYRDTSDALKKHVDADDKMTLRIADSLGRLQDTYIINESGFYSLVLSSKLPTAKKFKRWVTHEVLPSIRKHGAYMTPEKIEEVLMNPDTIIQLATALKEEQQRRLQAEKQIEEQRPKVLFADAVTTSKNSILVGELAKLLRQNGVDIGQNRLFKWLRNNGYLGKSGENYNLPTQYAMNLELFEIKKTVINNPDGSQRVTRTPKVTGKGQIYFVNKFKQLMDKHHLYLSQY